LASIPRLEDWALETISASHGILMNLGMPRIGWSVFEQHVFKKKEFSSLW
jgi:hypothetical protein